MSRFLQSDMREMAPYVPGEQPQDKKYIKLNTNESPYGPGAAVQSVLTNFSTDDLKLYPDPEMKKLRETVAEAYELSSAEVVAGGGSDEILMFAFMAFCERGKPVYFPEITYGFYKVYADLFGLRPSPIPLRDDFTIDVKDYFGLDGTIFIANPNAPTGIVLEPEEIREILLKNPDQVVVIDEAYIDFAPGKSAISLTAEFDNLLVVQTFSKSRALAGMRLGFGFGDRELICDMEQVKFSMNPYNIDRVSAAVAMASVKDKQTLSESVKKIISIREQTREELEKMDFTVLPSETNFLFAKREGIPGRELYESLKDGGILVRYFSKPRIEDYIRITIGTDEEMNKLTESLKKTLKNRGIL